MVTGAVPERALRIILGAISAAPMNATAGHADTTAPTGPKPTPKLTFAATVAATPRASMQLASASAAHPL